MGLSTPQVYAQLDALRRERGEDPAQVAPPEIHREFIRALQNGNPYQLAELLHNDLEEAALSLRPDLIVKMDAAREYGALKVIISGSGPTIAALAASKAAAKLIAERLMSEGYHAIAVSGPAIGAELVD
jgi:4-diphosphocytidyl-2-C-methyl-D-erythritol kinase